MASRQRSVVNWEKETKKGAHLFAHTFLEDGDTVIMRSWCERAGQRRIGFSEVAAGVRRGND